MEEERKELNTVEEPEVENTISNTKDENGPENMLKTLATVVMVVGIIGSFICFIVLGFVDKPYDTYSYSSGKEVNPGGIMISVVALFTTIVTSCVMKVLANISLSLKDINKKIK
ncbi:MAG: hypothetical protein MJZ74_01905 [Muribaculaceae bacterium]|nr:hypothetical protein [Muribaculaceae bacterium]